MKMTHYVMTSAAPLSRVVPVLTTPRPLGTNWVRKPVIRAKAVASDTLVRKTCSPCEEDKGSLDQMGLCLAMDRELAETLCDEALSGWQVVEDGHGLLLLERRYRMGSFLKALELCDRVAEVAEQEGHHPDIHLTGWNRLTLQLQTHSRKGLTENDYIMAAKIDTIPKTDLLAKKKKSFAEI